MPVSAVGTAAQVDEFKKWIVGLFPNAKIEQPKDGLTSIDVELEAPKPPTIELPSAERSSIRSGILSHGEHAVDLLLVQAAVQGSSFIDAFEDIAQQLCSAIANGRLEANEKIDGSPSIVLGYDQNDQAFVAYKGGLTRKTKQILFKTEEDVFEAFKKPEDPRRALYQSLIRNVLPQMNEAKEEYKNFIFQADLLFSEDGERKKVEAESICISSNTLSYKIESGHPLFEAIGKAKVSFVAHTIANREIDPVKGRINATSLVDTDSLSGFLKRISNENLLALDPFHQIDIPNREVAEDLQNKLAEKIAAIRGHFEIITPEVRELWGRHILPAFRVFNNSSLHPGASGGLFSKAAAGRLFSAKAYIARFYKKLNTRYKELDNGDERKADFRRTLKAISLLKKYRAPEFEALLKAYYEAISLQAHIDKALKDCIKSKLGGGAIEGLMLSVGDILVKWIDRLDFTRKNNARWNRGEESTWRNLAVLPEPFNIWKPGCVIIPMKLQPPHIGHIQMIEQIIAAHPGKEIIIVASDKQINLEAQKWNHLDLAPTRKKLEEREYTRPFSNELRKKILERVFGDRATITVVSPSIIRNYLWRAKEAKESSPMVLAIGDKERIAGTYKDDLRRYKKLLTPYYVPPQSGGISGTAVKLAFKESVIDFKPEAEAVLHFAFSYIQDDVERASLIEELKAEFLAVDQVAQRVLINTPRRKKKDVNSDKPQDIPAEN